MDVTRNLIILKGERRTDSIEECSYSPDGCHVHIRFRNSNQIYPYRSENVIWLRNPEELDIKACKFIRLETNNSLKNVRNAWEFKNSAHTYWHIRYDNLREEDYDDRSLTVIRSCLTDVNSKNVFDFLTSVAEQDSLTGDEGQKLLFNQYKRTDFIEETTVLSRYLNPNNSRLVVPLYGKRTCIFPFGCNASQQLAVERAFSNQISIIQGPPGTGKTQTILNIVANILCDSDKSVLIVSNNNSAIQNVYDKLYSYGYKFLVAFLGKSENRDRFIASQKENVIPADIDNWKECACDIKRIEELNRRLKEIFSYNERLANLRREYTQLNAEESHFNSETIESKILLPFSGNIDSKSLFYIWNRFKMFYEVQNNSIVQKGKWFFHKLSCFIKYKAKWNEIIPENIPAIILGLQQQYYISKKKEIQDEISHIESYLNNTNSKGMMEALTSESATHLKLQLSKKYGGGHQRPIFDDNTMWRQPSEVAKEYPIILSTTHSSRTSLKGHIFDYVIMDEASQVSIETGALALSVGRNVIIVGDSMQLPNVQSTTDKAKINSIFDNFNIGDGYNSAKYSFLESVKIIFPDTVSTLLREHYRCSPQIIEFCNQKFYGGNLLIMTKDEDCASNMSVITTAEGNHARGHNNEREAEVIAKEVLPYLAGSETGIIAPYRDQVNCIGNHIGNDIAVSTVHKFQGREMDNIIMSFTDNIATAFSDDPNLMNVAISRAKKTFTLVISSNSQPERSNVRDLMDYITYHNGEIIKSNIHSIFDLLYEQHKTELTEFMKEHGKESEYASECLTIYLVNKVLYDVKYLHLGILCHYPINRLIRDTSLLNVEEKQFAQNEYSHIDILIYNKVSHKPLLAIETDGYMFHRNNRAQEKRDDLKDSILSKYSIPLLRLLTTESNEEERIRESLDKVFK